MTIFTFPDGGASSVVGPHVHVHSVHTLDNPALVRRMLTTVMYVTTKFTARLHDNLTTSTTNA